ncbi:uncharacterized protein LOC144477500, partial [Augochlora pura]
MTGLRNNLTILQINLHRCKLAQDLMTQYVIANEINIVVISEPYRVLDTWYGDLKNDAAIWITRTTMEKTCNIQNFFKDLGIVAVEVNEIKIFSCYISPNITMSEFQEIIRVLEREMSRGGTDMTIIAGDFNAKAVTWGSKTTDSRGYEILELTNRYDMMPIRSKGDFTFERDGHKSLIDIIIYGKDCAAALTKSEIFNTYTASDHRYLRHIFKWKSNDARQDPAQAQPIETKLNIEDFIKKYHEWSCTADPIQMTNTNEVDMYIDKITLLVKQASKKVHHSHNPRKGVWWWNLNTAKARKEVVGARRRFQRARAKQAPNNVIIKLKNTYKDKKRNLKEVIKKAKNETWLTFIKSVDQDPWGKPYKWIINKIKGRSAPTFQCLEQVLDNVQKLFITTPHNGEVWNGEYTPAGEVDEADEMFGEANVLKAVRKVKKKAVGLDLVPTEVVWQLGKEG